MRNWWVILVKIKPPLNHSYIFLDRKNEQVLSAVTQISKQNTALEKEWETLQKSKAPLVLAQTENQLMLTDKKKYRDYITHIERKKAKAAEVMEGVKEEIGLKGKKPPPVL